MLELTEYSKFVIALLAVVDPLSIIPIFIGLTATLSVENRARAARLAVLTTMVILLIAVVAGEMILAFFGISIHSFRVAGGLLLLLMSIAMLKSGPDAERQSTATEFIHSGHSIGAVPLAMPLLAGPGAISLVIINAHKGDGIAHYGILSAGILLLGVVLWLTFKMVPWIASRMGTMSINISTRIMGLIVAAIAIEFIASGLRGLFPALS